MPSLGKKPLDVTAIGALVIVNVITPLDLDPKEQNFVIEELKWLFAAADNFLRVYQNVQQRLAQEKKDFIRKLAGDILLDRKLEREMGQITPIIWREEIERSRPINEPVPPEAEQSPQANNKLLGGLRDYELQGWGEQLESNLAAINKYHLRHLSLLIERERQRGEEGKRDIALQNQIKGERLNIVKKLAEVGQTLNGVYGILVTSPEQLSELLE